MDHAGPLGLSSGQIGLHLLVYLQSTLVCPLQLHVRQLSVISWSTSCPVRGLVGLGLVGHMALLDFVVLCLGNIHLWSRRRFRSAKFNVEEVVHQISQSEEEEGEAYVQDL